MSDSEHSVPNSVQAVPVSPQRDAMVCEALDALEQLLEAGELAAALHLTQATIGLAPDDPHAWSARSRALRAAGQLDAADAAEARAIERVAERIAASPVPLSLRQRIARFAEVAFLGGGEAAFVEIGQMQLMVLLEHGLEPHHRVLDIGCGALRAGLWLVKVLEPGHYCGIEPHKPRVRFGLDHVLGSDLVARKRPRVDHNAAFDLGVFGERFDFFVARSVWTHASKPQIEVMLDGFVACAAPGAVFLTSFMPARSPEYDYLGEGWVGQSESSPFGGLVCHDPAWIQAACEQRGLQVRALEEHIVNQQVWLLIRRAGQSA